jgi:GT2 family glycosyltransferase
MVGAGFPDVRIIANPLNVGFCRAANQGAKSANSRHYFFLNEDTIVLKNAIPLLIRFLDQNEQTGAIGSRLLNPDFSDQWSGRRFPSPFNAILARRSAISRWFQKAKPLTDYLCKGEIQKGIPFSADWVSAAAVMVKASVFQKIGGFAEDYYYWHEPIFCDRIRAAGKQVYLHPQSQIVHYEGNGSGERPYHVQKKHILDFHRGAYRCYCEHYHIGRFHPLRLFVGGGLFFRAATLLALRRAADL